MDDRRFHIVRGEHKNGRVTIKCPTLDGARDTLRRFRQERYQNIRIEGPDGAILTEAQLEASADGAAPTAPEVQPG